MVMTKYTVVRHSGYGYAGKEGFAQGLEVRSIDKKSEINLVEKVGGLLFDTWKDADDFTDQACFPEGYEGMYPIAQGTFSSRCIDELQIYIPVRKAVG